VRAFTYESLPARVIFGVGSLDRLPDEVDRLQAHGVLLVADPATKSVGDQLVEGLGHRLAGWFTDIQMHTPIEAVERARDVARDAGADCAITVGGGSTTGFGKAISLELGIPVVAIPTTYAGSEMTPIYGITSDGRKRTGRDPRVLPKAVIYDPALTVTLPPEVTGPSGINAMAHCVEALYAKEENPITSIMAEEGIRALSRGIPASVKDPKDLEARSDALYGAYLAGASLAAVGMALHHRICHVLGGTFGLAHGDANAVILPQVARYNASAAARAMGRVSRALGVEDAPEGLFDLASSVGAPTSLSALGMSRDDLPGVVRIALDPPPWNPRTADYNGVLALLEDAYEGKRPTREAPGVVPTVTEGSG